MGEYSYINIASGSGLLSGGTEPLTKRKLTYQWRSSVGNVTNDTPAIKPYNHLENGIQIPRRL